MPHRPTHRLTRGEKKRKKEEELERGRKLFGEPPEREKIPTFRTPTGELRAGVPETPEQIAEKQRLAQAKEELAVAPEALGLEKPGVELEEPEGIERAEIIPPEEKTFTGVLADTLRGQIEKTQFLPPVVAQLTGLPEDVDVSAELKASLALAAIGGLAYSVKGTAGAITNPVAAVQLGTAAKNSAAAAPLLSKLASFSIAAFGVIGTGKTVVSFFTRKVDDQQQALNTLGQITSTVVGSSTSARGDFKKGLAELRHIKREILNLESAIKAGTIKDLKLRFDGQIIDINADIFDQLSTIDEGIADIQSFALQGNFPQLSDFEIQTMLRELESTGHIKSVDLTQARRETT